MSMRIDWHRVDALVEEEADEFGLTGWRRLIDGRYDDGSWPEWHIASGRWRDSRRTFPDGRTQMMVAELPVGWQGYVTDSVSKSGHLALPGAPGVVNKFDIVYAALTPEHSVPLRRLPGRQPRFELGDTMHVIFGNYFM